MGDCKKNIDFHLLQSILNIDYYTLQKLRFYWLNISSKKERKEKKERNLGICLKLDLKNAHWDNHLNIFHSIKSFHLDKKDIDSHLIHNMLNSLIHILFFFLFCEKEKRGERKKQYFDNFDLNQ